VLCFFVSLDALAADWQDAWNKVVAGAKKEGKLIIYSSMGPPTRKAITTAMSEKYGITVEFVSARSREFVQRILSERKAGLFLGDVTVSGDGDITPALRPAEALERLDSALILPEVLDKKAWWGGNHLWVDKEHTQMCFVAKPQVSVSVNTNLVKPEQIKSYKDLLDPKWKGKILQDDPTLGGGGASWVFTIAETIGIDYLREFIKQNPVIGMDRRLGVEWVARGKYPIGIALKPEIVIDFIRAGAPIKFVEIGSQSARNDVPTDFLPPEMVRKPGAKYFLNMGEEIVRKEREFSKQIKEMYKPLMQ
jgi:iron(III) transport system substrate-binding protein